MRVICLVCVSLFAVNVCCLAQAPTPAPLPKLAAPPPGVPPSAAASVPDISKGLALKKSLGERLDRHALTVHKWTREAHEEIALSFAIGLLGLLVGLLQGSGWNWAKGLTVGAGFAISAMTLCTNTLFPADYRTLEISASRASSFLDQLNVAVTNFDPSQSSDNQRAAADDFLHKCGQIDLIEQNLLGKGGSPEESKGAGTLFDTSVYAQGSNAVPAWLKGKSADSAFTYFVGEADDSSLTQAKNESFASAVDQAAHWLRGDEHQQTAPEPTQQLLDLVKRSADVADTWYTYDKSTRVYAYFTLVRITNEFRHLDVKGLDPEIELGTGLGPFHFGMTPDQINRLLPHPFGSVTSLPVASEFKSAEVRYFWVYTAQFPPPDAPNTPFEALRAFQGCWGGHNSYVTFLFAQNQLIRISTRFFWDCPDRQIEAEGFADSYSIPKGDGNGNIAFSRQLSQSTIEIAISEGGTAVDVFKNGSPAP